MKYMSLDELPVDEKGIINNINGGRKLKNRLSSIGVIKGRKLEMLNSTYGPIIIKINELRLALGHGIAKKIIIGYGTKDFKNL